MSRAGTKHHTPGTLFATVTEHGRFGWWVWFCGDVDGYLSFDFDEADHLTTYELNEIPICL